MKDRLSTFDMSGLLLSLSGIVLGILLAVADYHVSWSTASALILTVVPMHIYMRTSGRLPLAASVAGAVLTVYLSYRTLFSLESLLLLLFAYFIMRMAKGMGGRSKISDAFLACFLKGPVALVGAYFVCTHTFPFWIVVLPSLSVGLLAVAADGTEDGYGRELVTFIIFIGIVVMPVFAFLRIFSWLHYIFVAVIPAFAYIVAKMYTKKEQPLAVYKSALSVCTFAFAFLAGLGFVIHLF